MLALLTLSLMGCTKDGGNTDDSGDTVDTVYSNPDGPQLSEPDACCYLHATGDEVEYWTFSVNYNHPLGLSNVDRFTEGHRIEIMREGVVLATAGSQPTCDNAQGICTGSFAAATYGVPCSAAGDHEFRFVLTDIDGNEGKIKVVGRKDATCQ